MVGSVPHFYAQLTILSASSEYSALLCASLVSMNALKIASECLKVHGDGDGNPLLPPVDCLC